MIFKVTTTGCMITDIERIRKYLYSRIHTYPVDVKIEDITDEVEALREKAKKSRILQEYGGRIEQTNNT